MVLLVVTCTKMHVTIPRRLGAVLHDPAVRRESKQVWMQLHVQYARHIVSALGTETRVPHDK